MTLGYLPTLLRSLISSSNSRTMVRSIELYMQEHHEKEARSRYDGNGTSAAGRADG